LIVAYLAALDAFVSADDPAPDHVALVEALAEELEVVLVGPDGLPTADARRLAGASGDALRALRVFFDTADRLADGTGAKILPFQLVTAVPPVPTASRTAAPDDALAGQPGARRSAAGDRGRGPF
jgi:hypothetical protein